MNSALDTFLTILVWLTGFMVLQRFLILLLFFIREHDRATMYIRSLYKTPAVYFGNIVLWFFFVGVVVLFASLTFFVDGKWYGAIAYPVIVFDVLVFFALKKDVMEHTYFVDKADWLLAPGIRFPERWMRMVLQPSVYLLLGVLIVYVIGTIFRA